MVSEFGKTIAAKSRKSQAATTNDLRILLTAEHVESNGPVLSYVYAKSVVVFVVITVYSIVLCCEIMYVHIGSAGDVKTSLAGKWPCPIDLAFTSLVVEHVT